MSEVYSTYDAKARFSEVMRKVRSGKRVVISYRGEEVAEIRPIERREAAEPIEKRLERLEREGVLIRRPKPKTPLRPIAHRPGALARFLKSRN
jgi:prevent-host-death family protein